MTFHFAKLRDSDKTFHLRNEKFRDTQNVKVSETTYCGVPSRLLKMKAPNVCSCLMSLRVAVMRLTNSDGQKLTKKLKTYSLTIF